jgi:copper chaperone NosL
MVKSEERETGMKRYITQSIFVLVSFVIVGCTTEPDPILFGVQECSHCRMTISERPYAAQIMTQKGRTHSFDAIECMMQYSKANFSSHAEVRHFRVADHREPHDMMDATIATYVISESIPSPMGGNLSAHQNHEAAISRLGGQIGDILTWVELVKKYTN